MTAALPAWQLNLIEVTPLGCVFPISFPSTLLMRTLLPLAFFALVLAANMVRVKAAYENHLETVRSFFAAPQRTQRLHYIDLLNDPLNGQGLCKD